MDLKRNIHVSYVWFDTLDDTLDDTLAKLSQNKKYETLKNTNTCERRLTTAAGSMSAAGESSMVARPGPGAMSPSDPMPRGPGWSLVTQSQNFSTSFPAAERRKLRT